tara:strand:+ start:5835 stop:6641 length:807 start_codon:yes stop_codon:yes gene_type:complete
LAGCYTQDSALKQPVFFLIEQNGLMKRAIHFDELLSKWEFDPGNLNVRLVKGKDGRDVIQMRIDMGMLQLETTGRPDGAVYEESETYLEHLQHIRLEDPEHKLNESECNEVDREFMQFYHRRICWLRLQYYHRAVMDADHTLRLMDLSSEMSPDEEWGAAHEQYRPFVLFHRTQAHALGELEDHTAEEAIQAINQGLDVIHQFFVKHEAEDHYEDDELVVRLIEMRESLRNEYSVGKTLKEQLAAAVEQEQYELAAKLRDELTRREAN